MRMLKIICLQFFLVSIVVIALELISYFITGEITHNIRYLNSTIFIFLVIILNPLIHERIIVKEAENTEKNQTIIRKAMKKFRARTISESDEVIQYKISKLYSLDGIVTIERFQDSITITGPAIVIRKLDF